MAALDAINTQWGSGTVRYAAVGLRPPWIMRCGHRSPRYTTRWEELVVYGVSADAWHLKDTLAAQGVRRSWRQGRLQHAAGALATAAAAQPVGDRHASYQKAPSCSGGREGSRVDPLVTWSRHGAPTCKRARDAGSRNSMSRCPSSVCTFTWFISSSMASTVARTVPWAGSLSLTFSGTSARTRR